MSFKLCAALALLPILWAPVVQASDDIPQYSANEFQVDLFGSSTFENTDLADGILGAGIGVNYFLTQNLGFGLEGFSTDTDEQFIDQGGGSLILRAPINDAWAPYLFLGADYNFERDESYGHAGAGLDLRLVDQVAWFVDGRYQTDFWDEGAVVGRTGIRVHF